MNQYKVGQMLILKEDYIGKLALSDDPFTIPKGTKAFIGADSFAHYLDGMIQPLGDIVLTKGYDTKGIAKWIFEIVRMELPFDEWSDEYDVHESDFVEVVSSALSELGFN